MSDAPVFEDQRNKLPFDSKSRPGTVPKWRATEFGFDDPMLKNGRWRLFYFALRELDPENFELASIKSAIAPTGATFNSNELEGRDFPSTMSLAEWQQRRYFLDPNVRAIYQKYDISKEHPGLHFRPIGYEPSLLPKSQVGTMYQLSSGWLRSLPIFAPLTWRYFNTPYGEECFTKTLVPAKYGVLVGTYVFLYDSVILTRVRGFSNLLSAWARTNYVTTFGAAMWGASSCLACNLRKKDDYLNFLFGCAAVSGMVWGQRGPVVAFKAMLLTSAITMMWYYGQTFEHSITKGSSNLPLVNFGPEPASFKWLTPLMETHYYDRHKPNF